MTAEVALLNKQAVALAADSKATAGSGFGVKSYDGVDKLFALSNTHAVGVMIYGNAEFMRVPWEVIIKEYREARGARGHDSIAAWGADFFDFTAGFHDYSQKDMELAVYTKAAHFRRAIEASALINGTLEPLIAEVETRRVHPALADLSEAEFERRYAAVTARMEALLRETLGGKLDAPMREQLGRLLHRLAIADIETVARSGVVIAGFGAKETFPALINQETDGMVAGRMTLSVRTQSRISADHPADVLPFAVRNVMISLVHGVDPAFLDYSLAVFRDLIRVNGERVIEALVQDGEKRAALAEENREISDQFIRVFLEYLREYIHDMHLGPFAATLQGMPPEEMGWLAESLVHLTSVKMRMSLGPEGVGGPVDVAAITKREGFRWIKRKSPSGAGLPPGAGAPYNDD
ncbi:MAG: hypothetical protein KIS81_11605 [Maricaulaceae bacterium]|nr:hypothetical protein [Maricaulaceae bacterium]